MEHEPHVGYTPTLIVAYGGLCGENYWYRRRNVWEDARLLAFVPRRVVDARAAAACMAPDERVQPRPGSPRWRAPSTTAA